MFKIFNWLKNVFSIFKKTNNKQLVGDVGLINAKSEINTDIKAKIADTQNNKLVEINNNSQKNQNFYIGMSYQDVTDIVRKEISLASNRLMHNIEPRLLPLDLQKVQQDFDFLSAYDNAVKISAKRKDDTINKTIEEIIIDRIKTTNDFEKMVSNESIKTIEKITKEQIEILLAMSLIHKCSFDIKTTEELIQDVKIILKPIFNKNFKNIDFEYLSYAGCLFSVEPGIIHFQLRQNKDTNKNIDVTKLKKDEDYKFIESKWNSTLLCKYKLTAIGTYIGLKYYKVIFNFDIPNIEKMFKG